MASPAPSQVGLTANRTPAHADAHVPGGLAPPFDLGNATLNFNLAQLYHGRLNDKVRQRLLCHGRGFAAVRASFCRIAGAAWKAGVVCTLCLSRACTMAHGWPSRANLH